MYWGCLKTRDIARSTGQGGAWAGLEHMWLAVWMCMSVRASNSVGTSRSEETNFSPGTVKSELHS